MATANATSKLAIDGGTSVRQTPMPARFAIGPEERRLALEALDYYAARGEDPGYQGRYEELYTAEFVKHLGGGYADAVATGTTALYVALLALQLPRGSEVLVSPITDPGSLSAIIACGLTPRLVDSMPDSFNIGVDEFRARITPKVKAAMVVHAAGRAAPIEEIAAEAAQRGIKVLEDCSQAHGAKRLGKPVGVYGDIAAFSTMYRKASISGSCGGVVYTRNEELYHLALAHADRGKPRWIKGFDDRDPTHFLFPALNLHTDEISCAIGLASIRRLPETISRRLQFVAAVSRLLTAESAACRTYGYSDEDSPFYYPVFVDTAKIRCTKEEFARAVRAEGIGLNPHYQYVAAEWPWLRPHLADDFACPNAVSARNRVFALYLNENYTSREARDVVDAVKKVERHFGVGS